MFGYGRSDYALRAALQSRFMTFLSKPTRVQSLQAIALGKRPHIIVGTPGRVVDHLSNTKVTRVVPMEQNHRTCCAEARLKGALCWMSLNPTPRAAVKYDEWARRGSA